MISLAWEGDWPISQPFGGNPSWYTRFGLDGHNGLDVAMPAETVLRAVEDMTIVEVAHDPIGYGYYVKGRTPGGADWLYAHLSLWELPRPGDRVEAGRPLALSGNSGNSTGPHLHIGYRPSHWIRGRPYNGYADPLPALTG